MGLSIQEENLCGRHTFKKRIHGTESEGCLEIYALVEVNYNEKVKVHDPKRVRELFLNFVYPATSDLIHCDPFAKRKHQFSLNAN